MLYIHITRRQWSVERVEWRVESKPSDRPSRDDSGAQRAYSYILFIGIKYAVFLYVHFIGFPGLLSPSWTCKCGIWRVARVAQRLTHDDHERPFVVYSFQLQMRNIACRASGSRTTLTSSGSGAAMRRTRRYMCVCVCV